MLAPRHRLRRAAEFETTLRRGPTTRRVGRPRLVVHVAVPSPSEPAASREPQVGFIVSKAVGGAVVRNRVRRRLRALVAQRLALLPPGTRLVVRAQAAAAHASFLDLATDLDTALDTAIAAVLRSGARGRRPQPVEQPS